MVNITIMGKREERFMQMAIELSREGMEVGKGGPFGTIVVQGEDIIGRGCNCVLSDQDPTAHAEIVAIREACGKLNYFQLQGCEIYTSCEPCPMCLGAIYWARPDRVYYANTRLDAEHIGFDDSLIYREIALPVTERKIPMLRLEHPSAIQVFEAWNKKRQKTIY